MKKIGMLFLAILMLGCASYTPPQTYNYDKSKVIQKNFDEVWGNIIKWFGENGTPIKTLEKASGLISTEYNLSVEKAKETLDCGSLGWASTGTNYIGNFNIIVERISDKSTKVTINTFFNILSNDYNFVTRTYSPGKYACNSTGILEKQIFDYISK